MDRVPPDPVDGANAALGPVVDAGALPAVVAEGLQRLGKRRRRASDLTSNLCRRLVVVPLLDDAFLPTHRCKRGLVLDKGQSDPLALHRKYVTHVTGIFER